MGKISTDLSDGEMRSSKLEIGVKEVGSKKGLLGFFFPNKIPANRKKAEGKKYGTNTEIFDDEVSVLERDYQELLS